jgi:hypothetical protein
MAKPKRVDRGSRRVRPVIVYDQVVEGEWHAIYMRGFRSACCDCGLVHRVNYRRKGGDLQMQVFRDERATAQVRGAKRRHRTMVK